MSEPNSNYEDSKAERLLELRVELDGNLQRVNVVIDGKVCFGSEFSGNMRGLEMALGVFMDTYRNSTKGKAAA